MSTSNNLDFTGFKYRKDTLVENILESLEKVNWRSEIRRDSIVFIKPNFTLPFYKKGVTSRIDILEKIMTIIKDRASEVLIGESDGGYGSYTAEYSLRNHGIPEICKKTGVEMVNLSQMPNRAIVGNFGSKEVKIHLPKVLLDVDITISVPVMKVHAMTGVSLSMKNLWGCYPDPMRLLSHKNLSEKLVLISKSINHRLSIVEAIHALNKRGPLEGKIVDLGAIFIGNNPVSTDSMCCRIMNIDPKSINHINIANKYGLGPIRTDEINTDLNLEDYQFNFQLERKAIDYLNYMTFKSNFLSKIVFDSPFTSTIYCLLRKENRKKILEPGDENDSESLDENLYNYQ